MFPWGNRGEASAEALRRETEVRFASLAEEVRAVKGEVAALQAKQVAYVASIAEATDKLFRLVERARGYARSRRERDERDAGDADEPGVHGDDAAFYDLWRSRQHLGGAGGS